MLQHDHGDFQNDPQKLVKILIAANDVMAHTIKSLLKNRPCECVTTPGFDELCTSWRQGPSLIIIDGTMQERGILALCRRIRLSYPEGMAYIIIITPDSETARSYFDIPYAPDDILASPFTQGDIEARITVGMRIIELEMELSARIIDLTHATSKIQKLNGLLPICSHCKKIRDDRGYWNELEKYISDHSDAEFSHAICPGCLQKYYPDVKDESL